MNINRREFLGRSLVLGAAATLPLNTGCAQNDSDSASTSSSKASIRRASDVMELGPAKVKASRMAVGTGTYGAGHNSNQLRALGVNGVADMLCAAYDKGIFFWDTADAYGTHAAVKSALKKVPREKVTILTKTDSMTAEET
ncbi:MAG TPA: aldo/keto reductase, partial [Verrucomicrobiae bacterium]|nr:aldo/keto reductase [Verrucomicrobiae bacterium]